MGRSTTSDPLIDLSAGLPWLRKGSLSGFRQPLESLLRVDRINEIHDATNHAPESGADYFRSCLQHLGVEFEVPETDLLRIPSEGPVVVVSNHACLAPIGLGLGWLLKVKTLFM